jgi:hypothetical protein
VLCASLELVRRWCVFKEADVRIVFLSFAKFLRVG